MDAREIELPVVDLGRRPPIRPEMTVRQVALTILAVVRCSAVTASPRGVPPGSVIWSRLTALRDGMGFPWTRSLPSCPARGATFSSACSAALRGPSHPSTGGWLGLLGLAGLAGLLRRSDPMHRRTNDGTRWTT